MRLTVLGSSGTYPEPGNPGSSYLISAGGTNIWCDAGPGSFEQLAARVDLADLDAVLLSHEHPDHCSDIFAAFHALAYGPGQYSSIPIFADQLVFDRIRGFIDAGDGHPINTAFAMSPVDTEESIDIGETRVTAVNVDHSPASNGFRIDHAGRSLFYTGDTGPNGSWADLIGGVDLLVSEATLQSDSNPYGKHLTAAQAGQLAAQIGADRLLLTHIPPHLDRLQSIHEAEATFGKTVMVAVPGSIYEV